MGSAYYNDNENDFDTRYTAMRKTNDKKEDITPVAVTPETAGTGQFKVTGDTDITVTNTRSTQDIVFEKTMEDSQLGSEEDITDVVFTLSNDSYSYTASPKANGEVKFTGVKVGTYTLAETHTVEGHSAISNHTVAVTKNGYTITLDNKEIDKNESGVYTIDNPLDTIDVVLKKVDDKGNTLENAKFTLKSYSGGTTGSYVNPVNITAGETPVEGLKVGTKYLLTETKAPEGYTIKQDDYYFQIGNDGVITVTDEAGAPVATPEFIRVSGKTIEVINVAGQPLPHTGGIGTTIFYILGSLLVIGCGIVLVSRKRLGSKR